MTARRRRKVARKPRRVAVPPGRRSALCPCGYPVASNLPATIPAGDDLVQSVACPGCGDVILFATDRAPVLLPGVPV